MPLLESSGILTLVILKQSKEPCAITMQAFVRLWSVSYQIKPFKVEAQTALFKDPVLTTQ
jgi:hypothetical protein